MLSQQFSPGVLVLTYVFIIVYIAKNKHAPHSINIVPLVADKFYCRVFGLFYVINHV